MNPSREWRGCLRFEFTRTAGDSPCGVIHPPGELQDTAGSLGNRVVDHAAVELDRRRAGRDRPIKGLQRPFCLSNLLVGGRERLVGELHLRRVDTGLAPEAEAPRLRRLPEEAVGVPEVE